MSSRLVYKILSIASIVCAVVVCISIRYSYPLTPLPPELFGLTQPTTEQVAQLRSFQRHNDTLALMIFGAAAMTVGVPFFSRKLKPALWVVSVVFAVALGSAAGWLMGQNGFYCQDWLPITWDVLVRVTVRWMAMLLPFALFASLLTVLFTRDFKQFGTLIVGGVIGCMVASIAYALTTAVLFPRENSDAVLPHSSYCRFVLFGLSPLLIWTVIAHQQLSSGGRAESKPSVELEVA